MVSIFDNEALFDIHYRTLKINKPSYADMNHLISKVMAGITCSLRYPGQLNSDLQNQVINMVPYPRLHFLMNSYIDLHDQNLKINNDPILAQLMLDQKNFMCASDPKRGKYLSASAMFRGKLSSKEVDE